MKLSEQLKLARCERPDEWTIDRFIRLAAKMESTLKAAANWFEDPKFNCAWQDAADDCRKALDPNNVMVESSIPEGCALSDKGVLRGIPKADWPEGWEDVELEDGYVLAGYGDGGRAEINSRNQMEGRPDFWVQSTNCWEAILYALPTNAPQSHFDRFTYEALETEYATLRAQVQWLADSVIAANQTRMDVNPMECINANALALHLAHKAKE